MAAKTLRQHGQLFLATLVALLLIAITVGGSVLAWRADERETAAARLVSERLVNEAVAQRRAAFLGILRAHIDGATITASKALSEPVLPQAAAAARSVGLALFVVTDASEIIAIDGGMRLADQGQSDFVRSIAQSRLASLQQGAMSSAQWLSVREGQAAYVFAEMLPGRRAGASGGQATHAIGVWLMQADQIAAILADNQLSGVAIGHTLSNPDLRASLVLRDELNQTPLHLSWAKPMAAMEQWLLLLPALLLAMVGVFLMIVLSLRFSRRSTRLVDEIETAAYDRATRDPLTGLHNRSGFKMRLDQALEKRGAQELTGVVYIDLDRFKEVNDGFGHEMGDKLLIAVTKRLEELCGRDVAIARLGGDEFAIVVNNRADTAAIVLLGQEASRVLGEPFLLGSTEVVIGGSVGIAVAPEDGTDSTELVRRADISMYRAKTAGRGQAFKFDASMEDEIRRRKLLEGELRHAIARNQLAVWYQPVLASDGETLIGVEALLRWFHPTEGMISPAVFIPLAEETGQIVEIGEWAMRRAMQDALRWPELSLAVNVSPVQFRRKDLVDNTVAMAAEVGIDVKRIEIEITEGVLMEDADAAIEVISGFRSAGMHVALDDFGTGYASLSYLRRFPFDKLKVDQAFVRNLGVAAGSAAIIHSVIALGRSLGMTVHAEGVETLEHHIFLRAAGCHHFQGYYFSKPLKLEDMDAFAAKHPASSLRYSMRG